MKIKLLFFSLVLLATGGSLFAQNFNGSYNFVAKGTQGPGTSFANTGITAFAIAWTPTNTVASCAMKVDSSADNVTWGDGDLIASQNCAVAGSVAYATLASGKNFVRVNVTSIVGNGGVNVTLTGSSGSGSGSTAAPAPKMAFYLTPDCSTVVNAYCQNTFADTQQANACSWTNASTTITCLTNVGSLFGQISGNVVTFFPLAGIPTSWAVGDSITTAGFANGTYNQTCTLSAVTATSFSCPLVAGNSTSGFGFAANNSKGPFVVGDVGKSAKGGANCQADVAANGMGALISTTTTPTILSFISSTQVALSATPANTSALNIATGASSCFIWGHLDDTAAAAVDLAMQTAPGCPKLFLAAANYFFASPHFYTNPNSCIQNDMGVGGNFGNTTLPGGMEIEGRGVGNTAWYLTTSFPSGDGCVHKSQFSASGPGGCFAIPMMGKWSDFRIDGGGDGVFANLANVSLIYAEVATLQNFTCINVGPFGTNIIGLQQDWLVQTYQFNDAGCGSIGTAQVSGTGHSIGYRNIYENNGTSNLQVNSAPAPNYSMTCYNCEYLGGNFITSKNIIQSSGGFLKLFGGYVTTGYSASNATDFGYKCIGAGCTLLADGFNIFANGGPNSNTGIGCTATCSNYLSNMQLAGGSSANAYTDVAGSKLFDDCGNTFTGPVTLSGGLFGSCSITGTLQTSGNWSVPAGSGAGQWGTSPSVATCSGNALVQTCTITVGSGTVGANPVLTITQPTTFLAAPSCDARMIGGTAAFQNFITGTVTTTSVPLTYNGTPAASSTIILKVSCSN